MLSNLLLPTILRRFNIQLIMHAEIHNEYEQGKLNNMAYIGVDDRRLTTDENIFQKQTYSSKAIEVYRSS